MITFTKQQAKDYLVRYHRINTNDRLYGYEGLLDVMDQLHFIQYDPLDVVGKNTDLTLQSRIRNYKKGDINHALYTKRTLIDAWDKMMGVAMTKDYGLLEPVRTHRTESALRTLEKRGQLNALKFEEDILNAIKQGPKFARDITLGHKDKQSWGHTTSSSAVLDVLFHKGLLGVRDRHNTQKQYDLMSRLIGDAYKPSTLTVEAFKDAYLLRRIETLGIMRHKKGVHVSGPYIYDNQIRTKILKRLLDKDLIIELNIEGVKEPCYISKRYQTLDNKVLYKISFLAPLDNMLYDRDFIEQVFDFNYKWEVYTPVKKRQYGYYVLPILYKDNLIGRIEFNKHRNNEPLVIKHIWLDKTNKTIQKELKKALNRFKTYVGASKIIYNMV